MDIKTAVSIRPIRFPPLTAIQAVFKLLNNKLLLFVVLKFETQLGLPFNLPQAPSVIVRRFII